MRRSQGFVARDVQRARRKPGVYGWLCTDLRGACRSHPSAVWSRSATATSALAAKARLSFNSFVSWWAGRECREELLSSSRSVGVRVVRDYPRTLMELERRCATDEVRREYLARLGWPWIPRPMPPMVRGGRGPKNKSHHMGLGVLE